MDGLAISGQRRLKDEIVRVLMQMLFIGNRILRI